MAPQRLPVLFIGHGNPMNALEDNAYTRMLARLGQEIERPRAVLCVSAHWMTEGSWVTHMPQPKTIHDFYGFPQALFDIQYPAPGSLEVSDLIRNTVKDPQVHPDTEMWGLDHGTWAVLRHMYPKADIPVVQLSLHIEQPAVYHYTLATQLRSLRDQGILIIGSGNIVHNLRRMSWDDNATPYDWAIEFDEWVKGRIDARDYNALVADYLKTAAGKLSVPTADHYYPLLYTIGASDDNDAIKYEYESIDNASISMRCVRWG